MKKQFTLFLLLVSTTFAFANTAKKESLDVEKAEFSSVQEMDIAYKILTTGKIVQSTIRTIEPFSAEYNKLHNIWYLGKSLPCLHCVLVQVGGVFPEDYKSYLEEGEEHIYTNDKNEYIKWYDCMLRNKKLTK